MHKCVLCGADTILLINGVPICVQCDEKELKKTPAEYQPAAEVEAAAGASAGK